MKRIVLVGYATVAYIGFLAVVVWAAAFIADANVLTAIDRGPAASPPEAAIVDLALLSLFALHHSVMARAASKRALTSVVPAAIERSTFVLMADLLLALVLWQWRPIEPTVWDIPTQPARSLLWVVYVVGWFVAVASTFMIDHFDLVGLRQTAARVYRPPEFRVRWLYAFVRHPMMLGLLAVFWVTPTMTWGHLLFASAASAYIAVGIRFEERDLRQALGAPYIDYAAQTPAVIPRFSRPRSATRTR